MAGPPVGLPLKDHEEKNNIAFLLADVLSFLVCAKYIWHLNYFCACDYKTLHPDFGLT